jgi:NADPH:quinone reductase-like Zn-dependent oxidoreductase
MQLVCRFVYTSNNIKTTIIMKAIILAATGSADQLQLSDIEKPLVREGEVLVQVKAISINPVDVKTRQGSGVYGLIKNEHPIVLGCDIAGVVVDSRSELFRTGDEVFGMVNFPGHGKAYAEYVAAAATQLARIPKGISFDEAAAASLAALTAWQALVDHAKVQPGQRVLIHAAAGGVGHFGVQLAKHLGARVTGTSSIKNKDLVLQFGADEHIDYHTYDWNSHPDQFDVIIDTVGGNNIDKSMTAAKPRGTVISIASGISAEVNSQFQQKGINALFFLVTSNGAEMSKIADLLAQGILKPWISQRFAFEHMADAHRQLESGRTVGKVVIHL